MFQREDFQDRYDRKLAEQVVAASDAIYGELIQVGKASAGINVVLLDAKRQSVDCLLALIDAPLDDIEHLRRLQNGAQMFRRMRQSIANTLAFAEEKQRIITEQDRDEVMEMFPDPAQEGEIDE